MARTHIDSRSRLVSAAVGLAYQNGFGATSLADIAREAEVPLGNVYYYFKTKDEIGRGDRRAEAGAAVRAAQQWSEAGSPKDRLCACVEAVFENKDFLAAARLRGRAFCSEAPQGGRLGRHQSDRRIFAQHLAWIESQFRALGKGKDSKRPCRAPAFRLARRFDLAHAFHDSGLVATENQAPQELDSKLVTSQAG